MGPSANINICSKNTRVGEFRNNTAHSNGRYGLRIFHDMVPRKFPCKPIVRDYNNETDPYWKNPPITANFYDFTGWKNNRNGAITNKVGDVRFNRFKTADNILAGIEMEMSHEYFGAAYAGVYNSTIIGKTANTEELLDDASPHGIIGPRSNGFTAKGVVFYNYDWNDAAAWGDCSHCFHPAATDSGSRTYTISEMKYVDTPRRIRYQYPQRGIFHDLDGTTSNHGPNSMMTFYYKMLEQPECKYDKDTLDMLNGVSCDNTV